MKVNLVRDKILNQLAKIENAFECRNQLLVGVGQTPATL